MNIMFIAAEAAPFAKVGGMADVVGSLPAALNRQEMDARVILPGYGFINHEKYGIQYLFSFEQSFRTGTAQLHVYGTTWEGVKYYFIQGWPYFGQEATVYTQWDWDVPRFIFFSQIAMGLVWELKLREGWFPDVVHTHDWHTGLVPFFLAENRYHPDWGRVASVLSIHNMAYQGEYATRFLWNAGIPTRWHHDLRQRNLGDNLMAIALAYSDLLSTVSPRYATEIQYPYMGYGLDALVRLRADDLYGILNGIDADLWNPATDKQIVVNYHADNFETERPHNKRHLQASNGLEVRDEALLIGVVSRLVWQKGFDMALPALREFMRDTDAQFILLGTGEPDLEKGFRALADEYHWKARAHLTFDGAVAQQIYAGCDLFLMPSHFEPCGIGQMMAMRYGALPLVRETGGLADTVQNYDNHQGDYGTGFVFEWEQPQAISGTLYWAYNTFREKRYAWQRMQQRAMTIDFSWYSSAKQYIDLYSRAVQLKRG